MADRAETTAINGFQMHYRTRGEGAPLVLLHGGGGVGSNWDLVFPQPPPGYCLIIPDLRGHGRSTNPSREFTFRQSALDVFALLDHLQVGRFKAVGVSLGAKTLLHSATLLPDRVEAIVLVSATPYFPAEARAMMAKFGPDNHTDAEWRQMREWHAYGDEQIRALWTTMSDLRDSYTDMNFTPPYLATIRARTLLVHGDCDPLYPVRVAFEMYSAIPHSYLWVVPHGGHGPIFGPLVPHFAQTCLAFLNGEWEAPDGRS